MSTDNYVSIDKGHCAGDRKLFIKIKKTLEESKRFKITEDFVVFTIIEIPQEQKILSSGITKPSPSITGLINKVPQISPNQPINIVKETHPISVKQEVGIDGK